MSEKNGESCVLANFPYMSFPHIIFDVAILYTPTTVYPTKLLLMLVTYQMCACMCLCAKVSTQARGDMRNLINSSITC